MQWPETASVADKLELARIDKNTLGHLIFTDAALATARYPHLTSVPYPSSFHWSSSPELQHPPWEVATNRHILMLFIGDTSHGDMAVRQRIVRACAGYRSKALCRVAAAGNNARDSIALKTRAVFCLEPVGDSPFRKSISDSIVLGCAHSHSRATSSIRQIELLPVCLRAGIPVFFSALTDAVAPWFWDTWKTRGRVLVPRDAFLSGALDLRELLEGIPPHFLSTMQRSLAANAKRFQFSLDDDPGDALEVLLHGILRRTR